jgi:hypothetical protein
MFFAFESCRPFHREACIFQPVGSNEKFQVDLSSLQTKCIPRARTGDWAVVKLKKKVPRTNFFKAPASDVSVHKGDMITMASFGHSNFKRGNTYPSSLQDCEVDFATPDFYGHTCDTGLGSSGSAHVVDGPDSQPVMVGMSVSYEGSVGDGGQPSRTNYNLAITLKGDFLKAINHTNGPDGGNAPTADVGTSQVAGNENGHPCEISLPSPR